MPVSAQQHRVAIGIFNMWSLDLLNRPQQSLLDCLHQRCNSLLVIIVRAVIFLLLLLLAGDVHPNPGPNQSHPLGICHCNIRSLRSKSKIDELKLLADRHAIDIITLSETWLNENDNNLTFSIPGFQTIIRNDRPTRHGGGVAVFCCENINYQLCLNISSNLPNDSSCLWIKVILNKFIYLLGTYYRPPGQNGQNKELFMQSLSKSFSAAAELNCSTLIIMGDFNDRCDNWHSDHSHCDLGLQLYNMIERNSLVQLINSLTRTTDTTSYLLDLLITDQPNTISDIQILPPISTCDHSIISCKVNTPVVKTVHHKRTVWDIKSCNFAALNESLINAPFDLGYELFEDVEDEVHYWFDLYKSTISEYIPHRTVVFKSSDKPWITAEFKLLIRKRNRLWKRFKKSGRATHYEHYKEVRNAAVLLNRNNIREYHSKIEVELNNSSDPKLFWKTIKKILPSKSSSSIPPIKHNDTFVSNDQHKAELFNNY